MWRNNLSVISFHFSSNRCKYWGDVPMIVILCFNKNWKTINDSKLEFHSTTYFLMFTSFDRWSRAWRCWGTSREWSPFLHRVRVDSLRRTVVGFRRWGRVSRDCRVLGIRNERRLDMLTKSANRYFIDRLFQSFFLDRNRILQSHPLAALNESKYLEMTVECWSYYHDHRLKAKAIWNWWMNHSTT